MPPVMHLLITLYATGDDFCVLYMPWTQSTMQIIYYPSLVMNCIHSYSNEIAITMIPPPHLVNLQEFAACNAL